MDLTGVEVAARRAGVAVAVRTQQRGPTECRPTRSGHRRSSRLLAVDPRRRAGAGRTARLGWTFVPDHRPPRASQRDGCRDCPSGVPGTLVGQPCPTPISSPGPPTSPRPIAGCCTAPTRWPSALTSGSSGSPGSRTSSTPWRRRSSSASCAWTPRPSPRHSSTTPSRTPTSPWTRSGASSANPSLVSWRGSPSSARSTSTLVNRPRRRTSGRCWWPWPRTSAWCSSSSPTGFTTCAPSARTPRSGAGGSARRPSTSTRRSPTGSASGSSRRSWRIWPSPSSTPTATTPWRPGCRAGGSSARSLSAT